MVTRVNITRWFLWAAVTIVCISLIGAFRIGIDRGLRDTIGTGSWGRVLFGVGAAITQMKHGGYGYTISTDVVETVLKYGGLTADPEILAPLGAKFPDNLRDTSLINAAIDEAAKFNWPFNPNEAIRGSGGDDLGLVDYVRLSFLVFGYKIQSLYYTYFLIFGVSTAVFLWTFRSRPALLTLLVIACVAQIALVSSNLVASDILGSIADPRFLGILAIVPGLHLGCLILDRLPPSFGNVVLAIVQSMILVFAVWIRASAVWVILAVAVLAVFIAMRGLLRRLKLSRIWAAGILFAVLKRRLELSRIWAAGVLFAALALHMVWLTIALHPIYKSGGEISHHVFWHSVFYQLQYHPRWNEKYAASYDFATGDELPKVAARKYLLRHPPSDPDAVYLTPDRKYLRVAAAETYIRKAFFEFISNDPSFVLESMLIYNPLSMTIILAGYASWLDADVETHPTPVVMFKNFERQLSLSWQQFTRTTAIQLAGVVVVFLVLAAFLATETCQLRLFKRVALLVTGGFIVSLSPILLTAPSISVMGEQYFALLIMLGSWVVLALAAGLRVFLGRARQVTDGTLRAA
jgi:hypothetical protein